MCIMSTSNSNHFTTNTLCLLLVCLFRLLQCWLWGKQKHPLSEYDQSNPAYALNNLPIHTTNIMHIITTYPVSLADGRCDNSIHPVPILIKRAEHEGEIVDHERVDSLQLVHILWRLGSFAGMRLSRQAAGLQAQCLNNCLNARWLAAAWSARHDDACRREEGQKSLYDVVLRIIHMVMWLFILK